MTVILLEEPHGCCTVPPPALPESGDAAAAARQHGAFLHVTLQTEAPSFHYISRDHLNAHELTNHIRQPSPDFDLRSRARAGTLARLSRGDAILACHCNFHIIAGPPGCAEKGVVDSMWRWCGMVIVPPTRTTGIFPRMFCIGMRPPVARRALIPFASRSTPTMIEPSNQITNYDNNQNKYNNCNNQNN
jgi:hypothetical protein